MKKSHISRFLLTSILLFFFLQLSLSILDRTYFTYLGLPITATKDDIQKAYKQKQQKIGAMEEGQEKQKKSKLLLLAFNTLTNPKQREKYQRYGKDVMKNVNQITSKDTMGENDSRKGKALNLELAVSIEDIYKGATIKTQFYRKVACQKCKGTGAFSPKTYPVCSRCQGKGFSVRRFQNAWGQMQTVEDNCPLCQGQGRTVNKLCDQCHGKKIHTKLQTINLDIPPFLASGSEIVIPNFGDQQQLGAPSDLKIKIVEIPSDQWQRSGRNNLIYKMKIPFIDSVTGFTKTFTHLNGEQIQISRNELTRPDNQVTLKQQGFPDRNGNKGDLIIKFVIDMPSFTDIQLDLWEDFFEKYRM